MTIVCRDCIIYKRKFALVSKKYLQYIVYRLIWLSCKTCENILLNWIKKNNNNNNSCQRINYFFGMIRYRYNEIKEISIEIFDLYIRNLELTKFNYFYFWSRYDVPLIFFDELNQRIGSSTLKRLNVKTICA